MIRDYTRRPPGFYLITDVQSTFAHICAFHIRIVEIRFDYSYLLLEVASYEVLIL